MRNRTSVLVAVVAALTLSSIAGAVTWDEIHLFRSGLTIAPIGKTGAPITTSYNGTQTVDIVSIAANTCVDQASITVTGAAANDECMVGAPTVPTLGLTLSCYVSAANTVLIRACAQNGAAAVDPASLIYYVRTFSK